MNFLHIVLLVCLMTVQIEPLQAKCKEPIQGPPGPQGIPGPKATTDSLFDYNTGFTLVPINTPVPFNQPASTSGSSVLVSANNSFTFTAAGTYFLSFIGYADESLGAGVTFAINGTSTGPTAATLTGALHLQQIISVQPGDILQVIATQNSTFAGNASVTITIMKLV